MPEPYEQNQQNQQKPTPTPEDIRCETASPSNYQTVIDKYKEDTAVPKLSAASVDRINKKAIAESKEKTACSQRKKNEWLTGATKEYNFLNNCIALYSAKDLVMLPKTIEEEKSVLKTFNESFTSLVKSIKQSKSQIGVIYELAKKLKDIITTNDNCYSEEIKSINACLKKKPSNPPLESSVEKIQRLAGKVRHQANHLIESTVTTAGINAYINFDTLIAFSTDVKTQGDAFTNNITKSLGTIKTSQEAVSKDLKSSLEEYSEATSNKYKAKNYRDSWQQVNRYIDNPDLSKSKPLDKLLKEAEDSYNNGTIIKEE